MKKYLFLLISGLLFSVFAHAQSIEINEVDKFTNTQTLETSYVKLGGTGYGVIRICLRAVDGSEFVRFKWQTSFGRHYHSCSIDKGPNIVFLDEQGRKYTFSVVEYTHPTAGGGALGLWGAANYGLDIFSTGDWRELKGKVLTDCRIFTTEGYVDIKLNKSFSKKITKLCEIFEESLIK